MSDMVERVSKAIAALAADDHGCYSDSCCCSGAEAFECKSGIKIEDIARAALVAVKDSYLERALDCTFYEDKDAMFGAAEEIEEALGKVDAQEGPQP